MERNWKNSMLVISIVMLFLQACNRETVRELTEIDQSEVPRYSVKTIVTGYEIIWGMDFLPGGDLLFNEKRGKLYRMSQNTITEISGFPTVFSSGQGGLLDLKVHPDYLVNKWIYATYTAREQGSGSLLRLVRFRITGDQVKDIENIFSTDATNTWNGHFGSRILFDRNKYLFLSVGEGGSTSYGGVNSNNKNAQDPASAWGKIHRMKDDGTVPADNPVIPGIDFNVEQRIV
jgi:glucose/arabinose dehydrogenase